MAVLNTNDTTERVVAVNFEGGETTANFNGVTLPSKLYVTEAYVTTDELAVTAGTANIVIGGNTIAVTGIATGIPLKLAYTPAFSEEAYPIFVSATSLTEPWSLHLKVIEFYRRDDEMKPMAITRL